jgi:acid phosphatase type 7
MSSLRSFLTGRGANRRRSHQPNAAGQFHVQATQPALPHYPFQPLPPPNGPAPYRFNLSDLLTADDIAKIESAGTMVCHTVGDTGDYRGQQQDFVAAMLTQDANQLADTRKPAFFYHLGDVIYFAGDIDKYPDNFYETYKNYPCFIVSIPGNHDCQPDDPADGPVDPNKKPLDGWIQNFMSKNPAQLGSSQTDAARTQMDLPNVYWTFNTPFATFLGLFSNVGETQGEIHQDQINWFQKELKAADSDLALIVTVHHPPYSGDVDHMGSTEVEKVLFESFKAAKRYPDLILSGHVHNYQRFTNQTTSNQSKAKGTVEIPCLVVGAGGYTNLSKLQQIDGKDPVVPLPLGNGLTLEQYDDANFGFLRLEISKTQILGTYFSAPYAAGATPAAATKDRFAINLTNKTVQTLS